jgi:hypothetical protein
VIAINQDELGVAGDLIWRQGTKRVSLRRAALLPAAAAAAERLLPT